MESNSTGRLVPRTNFDGPELMFDFPAMQIGVAEYAEGPTGCTVFTFHDAVLTSIDIRGGGAGTVGDHERNHAICFAGGSLPGLEVVCGVTAMLYEQRGYSQSNFVIGSGAIINDYRRRRNTIYPDYALGWAAAKTARTGLFPLGPRGAGRLAQCGGIFGIERSEPSGQGGAFRQVGPTKVGVFTVVNALGIILNRNGYVVRGNRDPRTGVRQDLLEGMEAFLARDELIPSPFGNTTLTLVVTNQRLTPRALRSLGRQVHASMARAIFPFQTIQDGDVLYAVSTNEVDNPTLGSIALGLVASELAWDAILASG